MAQTERYISERHAAFAVLVVLVGWPAVWLICGAMLVFGMDVLPESEFVRGLVFEIAMLVGFSGPFLILGFMSISEAEYEKEQQARKARQVPRETLSDDQRLEARKTKLSSDLDKLSHRLKQEKS